MGNLCGKTIMKDVTASEDLPTTAKVDEPQATLRESKAISKEAIIVEVSDAAEEAASAKTTVFDNDAAAVAAHIVSTSLRDAVDAEVVASMVGALVREVLAVAEAKEEEEEARHLVERAVSAALAQTEAEAFAADALRVALILVRPRH